MKKSDLDRLREECGVFGISNHDDASALVALGLHALQHRGQEGCGIVSFDGKNYHSEKRQGLVGDHFTDPETLKKLPGNFALGHNRYSTTGETSLRNIQPFFADLHMGGLSVAHNGNLTNIFSVLPDKIIPWKFLDAKEGLSVTGLISSFTATNENILKISDTTKNEVVTKLYNADSDLYIIGHKKHGFSFRMTDENDANEASKLAIGWSKITSVVPHHFDDGMRVKGQIHSDTDGMSQASLLSTTPVNGVDVELHKIIPSLNQVRYVINLKRHSRQCNLSCFI